MLDIDIAIYLFVQVHSLALLTGSWNWNPCGPEFVGAGDIVRLALRPVKKGIFGGMSSLECVPLTLKKRNINCVGKCNFRKI